MTYKAYIDESKFNGLWKKIMTNKSFEDWKELTVCIFPETTAKHMFSLADACIPVTFSIFFHDDKKNLTEQERETLLDMPVNYLSLSGRTCNLLKIENVIYVKDLTAITERDMLRWPNCGPRFCNEIKKALSDYGLNLATEE